MLFVGEVSIGIVFFLLKGRDIDKCRMGVENVRLDF